jgi:hypothetical protein
MGNPFADEGNFFHAIDTHDICCEAVTETVCNIESLGCKQFNTCVRSRLLERSVLIAEPISKSKITLCKQMNAKSKSRSVTNSELAAARNDCSLFSKFHTACQTRSGDLDTLFAHENQPTPPSLSNDGSLRFGSKLDLVFCLEGIAALEHICPQVDCLVLDGAAIVQMIPPVQC